MDLPSKEKVVMGVAATVMATGILVAWYAGGGDTAFYNYETNEYSTAAKKSSAWFGAYIAIPAVLAVCAGALGAFCTLCGSTYAENLPPRPRWLRAPWQNDVVANQESAVDLEQQQQQHASLGLGH